MTDSSQLTNKFPSKSFYKDTDEISKLSREEINILWLNRLKNNKSIYDKFNEDFKLFLTKISSSTVKKFVEFIFNKGIIFIGYSTKKTPAIFSRLLITTSDKIAGIVLDSYDLEINLKTGESTAIDDCIYATYYSLIRGGVLLNKSDISKNKILHTNLVVYLYQVILRSLGKGLVYNEKQKEYIKCVCAYIFHKHFLNQTHLASLSSLKRHYTNIIDNKYIDELSKNLDFAKKYKNIQDIPKILVDLKIITENPNTIIMKMIKIFGTSGFYHLIGPIDLFISYIVINRYTTGLFLRSGMLSEKLHKSVENIMVDYIKKIKFDTKAIQKHF